MESIWMRDGKIRGRESLPGDRRIHTAVIGGGMAGILTAYHLKKAGAPVIVLEADRIGSGQTGGTTAKITSQHGLIYDWLIRAFGVKMAGYYARANEQAIAAYEKLVREEGIDCHFTKCSACLYSRREARPLKREAAAAARLGIAAEYDYHCELPFPVMGVVRFRNQAKFHPMKFLGQIADKVTVYEHTKVLKVKENRIETDRGTVTAQNIIFACHYPFVNIPGYYFARMYQERSCVVALEKAAKFSDMYLGIDRDGLSFRSDGEILLIGGGAHRTGEFGEGGRYEMLRKKAWKLWPGYKEKAHWSAQDCMTMDRIPYIGRFSSRQPNWYVATGFGKWGMTSSMVSARILTDMILGRECREAAIFSPHRPVSLRAVKEFTGHGLHTALGLGKRLWPAKKRKTRWGDKTVIPVCPHLGCRLEWNQEEKTYECPCHGSQFDQNGKLVSGPAQTDCCCSRVQ